MAKKRFYFRCLSPLYKRIPLAKFLYWQSRFLTDMGARVLALRLLKDFAEQITFERSGVRWTMYVRDDSIGAGLFLHGEFDRCNVELMLAWAGAHGRLPQCDTILEVGANIGSSTIPFLQNTPCKVIAIEPVPRNLALLKQNLQQNG